MSEWDPENKRALLPGLDFFEKRKTFCPMTV